MPISSQMLIVNTREEDDEVGRDSNDVMGIDIDPIPMEVRVNRFINPEF